MEPDPWPFDQPRNCAVLTTTHVMSRREPITHVFYDEDEDGWQFHYPGEKDVADAMVVALEEVVQIDPSIMELADLPSGWMAVRDEKNGPWKRMPYEA